MRSLAAGIFAIAAIGVLVAGCNRNQPQTQTQPTPPPVSSVAPTPPALSPAPTVPSPIPPATELTVDSVDSVMLSRPPDAPMAIIVHVSGTAPSTGWTNPKLAEEPDNGADSTLKTYKLVATSPETPDESRTPQPIEADIRIDSLPANVKIIRIVSATNEISAPVAQ